ncbi:phosphoribosyl-AMP cyclohydrolase [Exiguobacterium sp. SH31]|uniref:phosphoribosyl-AMP cyclohydrolase n=1 Tax=Exiguobacterium sp. SH31 TaxID=1843183 RepID=UPI0008AE8FEA|nr:phosphoribosyl-AMP cyclohydrolase [Exiguobacterium sp. SH31]OGX80726.1 phosphoribosyl-AMP cyclohydrolase [Exiguobacterium sp. SH31]
MQREQLADAVRYNANGLIPAIIVSTEDNAVLMLGYMNDEAIQKTLETNIVTFWSRSKGRLWMKGESSGNTLDLESIHVDCDQDALLVRVHANGPTCHTGNRSCFFTEVNT